MKKKFLKITAFLLAVVIILTGSYYVLNFKYIETNFKLKKFYELEDNTVDILTLGSSHMYEGLNTAVLWREYGYTAFNLGGSVQPVWNTYYYLEEALKTQKPKIVILDTYMFHLSNDYDSTSNAIKNTYGLKWSETKIEAIKESFDMEEYGYQFFFEILQYHSRYSDLGKKDFYPDLSNSAMYKNHKGFYCSFSSTEIKERYLSDVTACEPLSEKTEKYYRKIIELAQSNNIELIVTAVPFEAAPYNEAIVNSAKVIADEYNVPVYDFLSDYKSDLDIDYSTDFANTQHLNHKGNTKLTRFFGNLFKEKYNITDKRGDEKYDSWEKDANVYYMQLHNSNVAKIDTLSDYTEVFNSDQYIIIVTSSFNDYDSLSNTIKNATSDFFDKINIDKKEYMQGGMWVFEKGKYDYYNSCDSESFSKTIRLDKFNTACVKNTVNVLAKKDENEEEKTVITKSIHVNKNDYTKASMGINICVYDRLTQTVIDSVCYNYVNGKFSR